MELDEAVAWEVTRPVVLIGGAGIWTEVLARLVFRTGGTALVVDDPKSLVESDELARPSAIVIGPPFSPRELVRLTSVLRERWGQPVVAVLDESAPADLPTDLECVGAASAVPLEDDLRSLCASIGKHAGVPVRHSHRGLVLAPLLLRSGHTLHAAIVVDVSEGGIGVEGADPLLVRSAAEAQFHLPGATSPITVAVEPAWIDDGRNLRIRAGLRFRDLDPLDRATIRAYMQGAVERPIDATLQ